jgi:hypothetical protein
MTDVTDALDAEIARLQAEVASVEAMPPTVGERYAKVEAEFREAERVFRDYGLHPSAAHPGEMAHLQRLAVVGACMVIGGDRLLKCEHQRVAAQGEGMAAVDKEHRLEELRRRILRQCARRELALREVERDGEFLPRPAIHVELVIAQRSHLEQLVEPT